MTRIALIFLKFFERSVAGCTGKEEVCFEKLMIGKKMVCLFMELEVQES